MKHKILSILITTTFFYNGAFYDSYYEAYDSLFQSDDLLVFDYSDSRDQKLLEHFCAEGHLCEEDQAYQGESQTPSFTVSPELESVLNALDKYRH